MQERGEGGAVVRCDELEQLRPGEGLQVEAGRCSEEHVDTQGRLGSHQRSADVAAGDVLVHGVRLDVLVEVRRDSIWQTHPGDAAAIFRDGTELDASNAARWPIAAPRSRRFRPNMVITLVQARLRAETSSMYAP